MCAKSNWSKLFLTKAQKKGENFRLASFCSDHNLTMNEFFELLIRSKKCLNGLNRSIETCLEKFLWKKRSHKNVKTQQKNTGDPGAKYFYSMGDRFEVGSKRETKCDGPKSDGAKIESHGFDIA